jgi:outer membrane protein, multidrug efflux system
LSGPDTVAVIPIPSLSPLASDPCAECSILRIKRITKELGIWSYGAQVSQPIFTGGALKGNLHLAESQHQQALIGYQEAIRHAFGEVSDALIGYEKLHQVRTRQQDSVADLQESVRISTLRYKGGTTTYLEVLDGQRSLYDAEPTLAAARGDEYRSLV